MKQLKTLLTIALCGLCMLANSQSLPCNNEFFVKHYKLGKANYDKQNYAAALHDIDIAGQICPTCQDCKTMLADCKAKIKATKIAEVKKILPTTKKFKDLPFADMVYVEGGTFMMGSNKGDADAYDAEMVNGKKHSVTVKGFYMGKYEVTQAQ